MVDFKEIQTYWVNYVKWTSWILPVIFLISAGFHTKTQESQDLAKLCPYQPSIAFFLSITMLLALILVISACSCCCNGKKTLSNGFFAVYGLFLHFFQLLGLFSVYSVISTVNLNDPSSPNYCARAVFTPTLFIVTYPLLILGLAVVCICYRAAND